MTAETLGFPIRTVDPALCAYDPVDPDGIGDRSLCAIRRAWRVAQYAERFESLRQSVRGRALVLGRGLSIVGTATDPPEVARDVCAFPGCGRVRRRTLGMLCFAHAKQRQRHGVDGLRPCAPPATAECRVCGGTSFLQMAPGKGRACIDCDRRGSRERARRKAAEKRAEATA